MKFLTIITSEHLNRLSKGFVEMFRSLSNFLDVLDIQSLKSRLYLEILLL